MSKFEETSVVIDNIPGLGYSPSSKGWNISLRSFDCFQYYSISKFFSATGHSVNYTISLNSSDSENSSNVEKLLGFVTSVDSNEFGFSQDKKYKNKKSAVKLNSNFSDYWSSKKNIMDSFAKIFNLKTCHDGSTEGFYVDPSMFEKMYDSIGIGKHSTVEIFDGINIACGVVHSIQALGRILQIIYYQQRKDGEPGRNIQSVYLPEFFKLSVRSLDGTWSEVKF